MAASACSGGSSVATAIVREPEELEAALSAAFACEERVLVENCRLYSSCNADIYAALGPCIGKCCFETDADVPDAMRAALGSDAEEFFSRRGEKWHVDLAGLNRLWLTRCGIPAGNITISHLCTACRPDLFWSHRKMGTARGLQAAAITCTK